MKLFEGFNAQKVILILVAAIVVIQIASMIWVGESEGYVSFAEFQSKPVFEILIVGLGIWAGYAIVTKIQGGRMTLKDIATLGLLAIAFWFVWVKMLGSPQISILGGQVASIFGMI